MKKRVPDKFWFPWWPDKWIFGSMRIECTVEERAIWVDLLSLASKDNGFIRANEEIPYPLEQLAGMLRIPGDIFIKAVEKFINLKDKDGKGKLTRMKDGTLYVTTWEDYQFSESYHRVQKYREKEGDKPVSNGKKLQCNEKPLTYYITLEDNKLNYNKENTEILNLLSKVKDYPYNKKRDREFIEGLITEFPDLDALEEIKKKCAWWLSNPLLKKSNPHLQIRNWFIKAREFLKEGDKEKKVGESTHIPSREEDNYSKARAVKMKQLQKKYQPEIDKAMKAHASDWLDEIDNKIKEGIAEFSHEYHKKEGK